MSGPPVNLLEALRICNDRLGMYSDHEGDEGGPTFYFWQQGQAAFDCQSDRAIEDHKAAIRAWRALKKANANRPDATRTDSVSTDSEPLDVPGGSK